MNTKQTLDDIVLDVREVNVSTSTTQQELENLTSNADRTTEISKHSRDMIVGALEQVEATNHSVQSLAPMVKQISDSMEEMTATVEQIASVSQTEAERIRESSQHILSLGNDMETIRQKYSLYKVKFSHRQFIELAITDHHMLKLRLASQLQGLTDLDPNHVHNDRLCRLGKWYYTDGQRLFGKKRSFQELESHHQQIHRVGAELIQEYKRGNLEKAYQLYQHIEDTITPKMMEIFDRLKNDVD